MAVFLLLTLPKIGQVIHLKFSTMKKTAAFVSSILLCSSLLPLSQSAFAMDKKTTPTPVENVKKSKPVVNKVKKPKKPKTSTGSSGRCKNPNDRDASGKRCGKRAASARAGGSS
jgi:hypothetical protein